MFYSEPYVRAVAIAKLIGLGFGLIGFFLTPYLWPDADWMLRLGILLWYITVGAVAGLGVIFYRVARTPFNVSWWFMGPWVGGWMNFIIVLFNYDLFRALTTAAFGVTGIAANPFWFVLEGAVVGLVCAYGAHKAAD
ncbi:hypothetical protein E1162_02190 [Rhodobacteraceae bacterium RKSG542]|uniref:hypothetical protein n=1 Tax=Pseudovibrio flavus TaxID=2529854 RepID=UPI0012BD2853|nr:hypothetical protein [Pseudovibrio flavus]MTI16044.1 hypothetical protein [Pseudovibrio flavus]